MDSTSRMMWKVIEYTRICVYIGIDTSIRHTIRYTQRELGAVGWRMKPREHLLWMQRSMQTDWKHLTQDKVILVHLFDTWYGYYNKEQTRKRSWFLADMHAPASIDCSDSYIYISSGDSFLSRHEVSNIRCSLHIYIYSPRFFVLTSSINSSVRIPSIPIYIWISYLALRWMSPWRL